MKHLVRPSFTSRRHLLLLTLIAVLISGTYYVARSQASGNPLAGVKLYNDPNSAAAAAYQQAVQQGNTANAALLAKISAQPTANWISHDWVTDTTATVNNLVSAAVSQGALAQLVLYDIPHRDCGSYSAGGQPDAAAYKTWIGQVAAGIGSRRALLIVEPDALAGMDCLSAADQTERTGLISYAVSTLKANPATIIYVDGGGYTWLTAETMAARLQSAGIAAADGFSLNVSNFGWAAKTEPGWSATYSNLTYNDSQSYGDKISSLTGGKHFVIDTSRDGLGPTVGNSGDWCNPPGKALGRPFTTATGDVNNDAFLWIKRPGESDGTCNGGPAAGTFWLDYALGLAQRQPAYASALAADLNGDGHINIYDLSALLSNWNTGLAAADVNHDGTVNVFDLSALLSGWTG